MSQFPNVVKLHNTCFASLSLLVGEITNRKDDGRLGSHEDVEMELAIVKCLIIALPADKLGQPLKVRFEQLLNLIWLQQEKLQVTGGSKRDISHLITLVKLTKLHSELHIYLLPKLLMAGVDTQIHLSWRYSLLNLLTLQECKKEILTCLRFAEGKIDTALLYVLLQTGSFKEVIELFGESLKPPLGSSIKPSFSDAMIDAITKYCIAADTVVHITDNENVRFDDIPLSLPVNIVADLNNRLKRMQQPLSSATIKPILHANSARKLSSRMEEEADGPSAEPKLNESYSIEGTRIKISLSNIIKDKLREIKDAIDADETDDLGIDSVQEDKKNKVFSIEFKSSAQARAFCSKYFTKASTMSSELTQMT